MQADNINKISMHLCIYILFFSSFKLMAQEYGLKFMGHNVTLDNRTELNLSPEDFINIEDEFELSFDLKLEITNPDIIFGYVFRIINQENKNIDLLSSPTPVGQLNLVIGNNDDVIPIGNPSEYVNNWYNFRIKIFLSEDRMVFYTPDSFYVYESIGFLPKDAIKIIFGANDYKQFKTTDVPSINLRNIKIYEKGKLRYHWPLDVKEGNIVEDRVKGKKAFVKNPNWLMLSHQSWKQELNDRFDGYYLTAVDKQKEIIYFLSKNNYHVFTLENKSLITKQYKNDSYIINSSCRAVFNNTDGKIYCYMVDDRHISSLNIETGEWECFGSSPTKETKYRHHNSFLNSNENSAYLFGGYGFHNYSNDVIKLDFEKNEVEYLSARDSVFRPRYLSGLGELNDTIYLFGGYGSETGNQLINPQSYYDLIGYSFADSNFFKKFEIRRIIDDMAVANSIWIDAETRDYYALIFEKSLFNGYLQLIKGSLEDSIVEIRGDKIPFQFIDTHSFADLFYAKSLNKLFAFGTYHSKNNQTQISIYSISYPPDQASIEVSATPARRLYLWIFLAIVVCLFFALIFLYRKKKGKNIVQEKEENEFTEQSDHTIPIDISPIKTNYQIIFFGGFQVFDKNQVDITNKFSPLLKELFLLITLYTFKNDKGISSEKITEILWFGKSEKSARNNRAVNIAKLRSILSEIGSCELTKKTGYWKINPDLSDVKSDYIDFLQITSSKTNLTKQKILDLIRITEKGPFLHNLQYEWLDEFKASISEEIIDILIDFANSCDIVQEAEFIIHLANSVFYFDIVNEDAMILKCRAEYVMGKHSIAKATYEKFYKEYKMMYGQEYEQSFLKVLEINN